MDINGLRYALSIISLIAIVIAIVGYFSNDRTLFIVLLAVGVACKIAEVVIRICHKKK